MQPFTISTAATVLIASISYAAPLPSTQDNAVVIASFDGSSSLTWRTENDPVMGGQSTSNFTIDAADKIGKWEGQVRIVPFLHAAGFCTLRGDGAIPPLNVYTGLEVVLKREPWTNLSNYQLQFTSSDKGINPRGGEFQVDFTVPPSLQEQKFYLPFEKFVESWRGEKVGGAPTAKQLASVIQIGVGSDGIAGDFSIDLISISAVKESTTSQSASVPPTTIASFTEGDARDYNWIVVNDPVMGGRSKSTFKKENGVGIFNGTVAIVPQLKAPGFCNAEARPGVLGKVPDVSSYLTGGGILYTLKSTGPLSSFKAAFGTSLEYDFNSYKADFSVPVSGNVEQVFIPFTNFSNKWSAATGEPTTKCSEDPSVCPTAKSLMTIGSIGIWAEGEAGDFHVELHSIAAAMGPN